MKKICENISATQQHLERDIGMIEEHMRSIYYKFLELFSDEKKSVVAFVPRPSGKYDIHIDEDLTDEAKQWLEDLLKMAEQEHPYSKFSVKENGNAQFNRQRIQTQPN
jgi:hypothetical protein